MAFHEGECRRLRGALEEVVARTAVKPEMPQTARRLPECRRQAAGGRDSSGGFPAGEPLRRVHECVFGILVLESEPVDPRL